MSGSGLRSPPIIWAMCASAGRPRPDSKNQRRSCSYGRCQTASAFTYQKPYYSKLTYGYARGHEAYAYVENIRKYQISLVGYLQEKEKQATEAAMQLAQDYPAVSPAELGKGKFPFLSFLSQSSSNYLTHSPSLLFSRKGSEEKQN